MNSRILFFATPFLLCLSLLAYGQNAGEAMDSRAIQFPDIPSYHTLKCDLHTHTVFSDGSVWPNIRVQEAIRDGLDAIAITDHVEYQPHRDDIPHPDRNRSYELARRAARGSDLIVIRGVEITRSMPPGHANAIFIEDANKLQLDDVMEVFKEANRQGAFVFWNHPAWIPHQQNGIASLRPMHIELINNGWLHGAEVFNEFMYSDETLEIALENGLTLMATSDIHGLIDWQFDVPDGGHRPVTLVFATERTASGIKEGLQEGRTVVWAGNTLVGDQAFLVPLILQSLEVQRTGEGLVQDVEIRNISDAEFILENLSPFRLHNLPSVLTLPPHETTLLQVKTVEDLDQFELRFRVLNAFTDPDSHPEIALTVEP